MIIQGGENIHPAEIEQFLHTHPKVQEAQVNSQSVCLYMLEQKQKDRFLGKLLLMFLFRSLSGDWNKG